MLLRHPVRPLLAPAVVAQDVGGALLRLDQELALVPPSAIRRQGSGGQQRDMLVLQAKDTPPRSPPVPRRQSRRQRRHHPAGTTACFPGGTREKRACSRYLSVEGRPGQKRNRGQPRAPDGLHERGLRIANIVHYLNLDYESVPGVMAMIGSGRERTLC